MRSVAVAILALAALLGGACGGSTPAEQARSVRALPGGLVPPEVGGLTVAAEDVSVVEETKRPFVDAVGLYSLRRGELLQATLQVSRFTEEADATSPSFRRSVVSQIGSTTPRAFRVGSDTVWLTTGRRQSVAMWWRGRHLLILSTREDYETPRALLRSALEIQP